MQYMVVIPNQRYRDLSKHSMSDSITKGQPNGILIFKKIIISLKFCKSFKYEEIFYLNLSFYYLFMCIYAGRNGLTAHDSHKT